jgi:hypothetical protein
MSPLLADIFRNLVSRDQICRSREISRLAPLKEYSMISLLYISYSLIDDQHADKIIQDIVNTSKDHNRASDITGALVFTGTNFAQYLEGPEKAVLDLMKSIEADLRHKDVWLVSQNAATKRRFANWSMAYGGRSGFVNQHIIDLLNTSSASRRTAASEKIVEMMEEFAKWTDPSR